MKAWLFTGVEEPLQLIEREDTFLPLAFTTW